MKYFMRMAACMVLVIPQLAWAKIDVQTTRIAHGVSAWYASNPTVPVVHVTLAFEGAGSVSDPSDHAGRAHMVAAMLREGAGPYDALGFSRALEEKAIDITFTAHDDYMTIDVHALRDQAVAAGALLAIALAQPNFAPDDMARVKTQTLSQLAQLAESPGYQASQQFAQTAFSGHPYASPAYGTAASITALTPDDLRRYMATYMARGNVVIAAAGDVDAALLEDMLEPVIDALGSSEVGAAAVSPVRMQGAGQQLRVPMQVPQTTVLFAAPGIARSDPRFYAYYLLNDILGGNGFSARLIDGVRQKKGLVYSINTALDVRAGVSLLRGGLATRTERAPEAIAAVKDILNDLRTRGATTQECDDARAHVQGSLPLQLDSSRSIAATLLMMRLHDLGEDYLDTRAEKFAAVRCADVNALAAELLAPEHFLFVTAGAP